MLKVEIIYSDIRLPLTYIYIYIYINIYKYIYIFIYINIYKYIYIYIYKYIYIYINIKASIICQSRLAKVGNINVDADLLSYISYILEFYLG